MLYDNVKKYAKERDVPIYRIELDCGLSKGSICKWNTISPSVKKLKRVADYLCITTDFLLDDSSGKKELK